MLIYDHNKQLVAMDDDTLQNLGYTSFADFLNSFDDIAELFVKKPGFIHNFQNFPWIDFVIHADTDDTKAIIAAPKRQFSCNLEITPIHMRNAPEEDGYIIHLRHIKVISGEAAPTPQKKESRPAAAAAEPKPTVATPMIEMEDEPLDVYEIKEPVVAPVSDEPLAIDLDMDLDLFEDERAEETDALFGIEEEETFGDAISEDASEYLSDLENDDSYKYNPHIAADELGLPVELIEEFIEDFIQQSHEFKEQLFEANDAEDFDEVHVLSHKLKGVAANLRIEDAFEILKTVNESKDTQLIDAYLKQFYRIIARMEGKAPEPVKKSAAAPVADKTSASEPEEDLYDLNSALDLDFDHDATSEESIFEETPALSAEEDEGSDSLFDLDEINTSDEMADEYDKIALDTDENESFFTLQDDVFDSEAALHDKEEALEPSLNTALSLETDETESDDAIALSFDDTDEDDLPPLVETDLSEETTHDRLDEEDFSFEFDENESEEADAFDMPLDEESVERFSETVEESDLPKLLETDKSEAEDAIAFSFDDSVEEDLPPLDNMDLSEETTSAQFDEQDFSFEFDESEPETTEAPAAFDISLENESIESSSDAPDSDEVDTFENEDVAEETFTLSDLSPEPTSDSEPDEDHHEAVDKDDLSFSFGDEEELQSEPSESLEVFSFTDDEAAGEHVELPTEEDEDFEMLDFSESEQESDVFGPLSDEENEIDSISDILSDSSIESDDLKKDLLASEKNNTMSVPLYDPRIAARELGLPSDMIQELTQDFIQQVYASKSTLDQANEAQDFATIDDLSHKLRGVAANLRITPVVRVLKDLNNPYSRDQISENIIELYELTDALNAQSGAGTVQSAVTESIAEEENTAAVQTDDVVVPPLKYDVNEAAKAIGITPEFVTSLINELFKEAEVKRMSLLRAIEENDIAKVKKIYLEFKGVADNLRINELSHQLNDALACLESECITRYNSILFSLLEQLHEIVPDQMKKEEEEVKKDSLPFDSEKERDEDDASFRNIRLEYDRESAAKELGIGKDFILALLKEFVLDAEMKREKLEKALKEDNLVKVQAILLEFKGIADNLRIQQISDILDWAFECSDAVCLRKIERAFYHLLNQFKF